MATLVLPDIPEDIYQRLNETASAQRRSVPQQALILLRESLIPETPTALKPTWADYAAEMKEFWDGLPADARTLDEIIGYDEHGLPR